MSFLAMELLQGTAKDTTEGAYLDRLSLKEGMTIGLQMLRALAALHERGFVHRDVKPSNFMSRTGTSSPAVCLIDFGLPKTRRCPDGLPLPVRYGVGSRGPPLFPVQRRRRRPVAPRRHLAVVLHYRRDVRHPLPRHGRESSDDVANVKRCAEHRLLLELPPQLREILDHVAGLPFEDAPDHKLTTRKLIEVLDVGERQEAHDDIQAHFRFLAGGGG